MVERDLSRVGAVEHGGGHGGQAHAKLVHAVSAADRVDRVEIGQGVLQSRDARGVLLVGRVGLVEPAGLVAVLHEDGVRLPRVDADGVGGGRIVHDRLEESRGALGRLLRGVVRRGGLVQRGLRFGKALVRGVRGGLLRVVVGLRGLLFRLGLGQVLRRLGDVLRMGGHRLVVSGLRGLHVLRSPGLVGLGLVAVVFGLGHGLAGRGGRLVGARLVGRRLVVVVFGLGRGGDGLVVRGLRLVGVLAGLVELLPGRRDGAGAVVFGRGLVGFRLGLLVRGFGLGFVRFGLVELSGRHVCLRLGLGDGLLRLADRGLGPVDGLLGLLPDFLRVGGLRGVGRSGGRGGRLALEGRWGLLLDVLPFAGVVGRVCLVGHGRGGDAADNGDGRDCHGEGLLDVAHFRCSFPFGFDASYAQLILVTPTRWLPLPSQVCIQSPEPGAYWAPSMLCPFTR